MSGHGTPRAPRGLFVVIAGPDGVGKTAVARGLARRVGATGEVLHLHARPHFLPGRVGTEVTMPHQNRPYGRAGSIGKLLYLYADFTLGWYIRLRPFVRRGGTIVMERGWWDLLVDPQRYRMTPLPRVVAVMSRLLPATDAVMILEAPTDILLARKNELLAEELARQAREWRSLRPSGSRVLYLDATRSVHEIVDEAWAYLQRPEHPTNVKTPKSQA